uniref:HRDC domain-containing protein n=1 Tax=Hyaloperonospora arabidopsidis (strain Emoy2) TaxID=559515 RepID=M4BQM5_HYAAE
MRVKKLNVNRRQKPGEDDAVIGIGASGEDSEQLKWVSPTKSLQGGTASSSSNSGASSPTDAQQQYLSKHLLLPLQPDKSSSELFAHGASGVAVMPTTTAAVAEVGDVGMGEEEAVDKAVRKDMVDTIIETLRAMKPQAPEKVLAGLPRLAQHMEKALLKLAKNEVEYSDHTTLRARIAQIQETNAKRLLVQQQQQQRQQQTSEQNSSGHNAVPALKPLTEEQACVVFQHLQSWRQKLVNVHAVAPWDILPNPTLAKVALYMPSSESELAVCGVGTDRMTRFGSSLMQELQRLRGSNERVDKPGKATTPSTGKRSSPESMAGHTSNKKQKEDAGAQPASVASSGNSLSSTVQTSAPLTEASLPILLPMVSMRPGGGTSYCSTTTSSPMTTSQSHCPSSASSRAQTLQHQSSACPALENHMHLLVQGAGQLSKQQQQHVKSLETYEQEVQSLRWMLHQSQQEKAQLETEVQRLRAALLDTNSSK